MRQAFVIGHPIAHSKSPLLHGQWLKTLGISGSYEAVDVAPEQLREFIHGVRNGKYVGGNATVPHKEDLITHCDVVSPTAKTIGAANTVWMQDGKLHGDNTDKYGFLANLDQQHSNWDKNSNTAIVLGAGGAARAVLVALIERGFKEIILLNRTIQRAQNLAEEFNAVFENSQLIKPHKLSDFATYAPKVDFLVNTSSVGMHGSRFEDVDLELLPKHAVVGDIVYTPLETPLLADAKKYGLVAIDGVGMLLHQAVPGFEQWFGTRPHVTKAERDLILGAGK